MARWRARPRIVGAMPADRSTPPARDRWLLPVLAGLLPQDALAQLVASAGDSLWASAVRRRLVDEARLMDAACAHYSLTPWEERRSPSPAARDLVAEEWARRFNILPVDATGDTLTIATANPFDLDCERALSFATRRSVRPLLASPDAIARALDWLHAP
jgi:hypothetical protein